MRYSKPVTEIIERRYSCRTYEETPIEDTLRRQLESFLASNDSGPFSAPTRFKLVAATPEDSDALRGLGTYGFIRGATGFILGAVSGGDKSLEDFGYRMEDAILYATALDLGTCWLGGTFSKSAFGAKMDLREGEVMPCVVSVGYISHQRGVVDRLIRRQAGSNSRRAWNQLFFDRQFGVPLLPEAAGAYAEALEMVRLGPSASNKQPWRVVRGPGAWHFYLQRAPGYLQGMDGLFVVADLQRVDMGIALCHFELSAREAGLPGRWIVDEPDVAKPADRTEYTASWIEM
jgi:nitroreductase